MPARVDATLEVTDSGGVECENCKTTKDNAVSLDFTVGAVVVMFILCEDCINNAISSAVEDGESTTFKTTGES